MVGADAAVVEILGGGTRTGSKVAAPAEHFTLQSRIGSFVVRLISLSASRDE
jgi:hypothetical protein